MDVEAMFPFPDIDDELLTPASDTWSQALHEWLSNSSFCPELHEMFHVQDNRDPEPIERAIATIPRGNGWLPAAVLLSCLPNLTSLNLRLGDPSYSTQTFLPIVRRITRDNHSALQKLRTVKLTPSSNESIDYLLIKAFMAFPSVRTIHGIKAVGMLDEVHGPPEWCLPLVTSDSNVSKLILDGEEESYDYDQGPFTWLHNLLPLLPRLRDFRFSCSDYGFNAGNGTAYLVATLLKYVAKSLEHLFIKGFYAYEEYPDLRTLGSFTALQSLEISYLGFLPLDDTPAFDIFQRLPPNLRHLRLWEALDKELVRDLHHFPQMIRRDVKGTKLEKIDLYPEDMGDNSRDSGLVRELIQAGLIHGILVDVSFVYQARMPDPAEGDPTKDWR